MEKYSGSTVQSVFKFSNISCILKYSGYLDQWKRLLESISSQTRDSWIESKLAFINFGSNYKRSCVVNDKIRNNFKEFWMSHDLFEGTYVEIENLLNFLIDICFKIPDNHQIICGRSWDANFYQIQIESIEYEITNLPALKCQEHKPKIKKFRDCEKRKLAEHLNEILYFSSIIVTNDSDNIQVLSIKCPILKLTKWF